MQTAHKLLLMLNRGGLSADGYMSSLSPELFYKFNETSGTAVTNYGTLGGTGTWTAGVGTLNNASPLGLSYDFDGLNSKIDYANNATMANAEEFSGGALVYADSAGEASTGTIWCWGNLTSAYMLRISGAGLTLVSRVDYTTDAITLTSTAITTGAWQWIFWKYSLSGDRKMHLYRGISGVVSEMAYTTNTASATTYAAPSGTFTVGAANNQSLTWDGKIARLFWKGSALATSAFDQIMALTPGV